MRPANSAPAGHCTPVIEGLARDGPEHEIRAAPKHWPATPISIRRSWVSMGCAGPSAHNWHFYRLVSTRAGK